MTVIKLGDRTPGYAGQFGESARFPELAVPCVSSGHFTRHLDGWPGEDRWRRSTSALVGRDQDLEVVRAFADARGRALLLSGDPGVGKSALLDAAEELAAAADVRVLRAAGAQFEDVSFSGLNQVLLPLRADVDLLDDLQRNALSVALGWADGRPRDRLVVSNAALALLQQTATVHPLLVIVDNLQWLDRPSALVLGFVVRRLACCRVGFLAAERTGTRSSFALDVPRHEVAPLDDEASASLVAARFPDLAPAVRQRIVAEAQGNPLALLELPAALSGPQRAALVPLPAVMPLSRRLRPLFAPQVSELPASTRYLLLLAVLEGTGDLGLLQAAAAAGQREIDDLAPAEEAGLVYVAEDTGRVAFRHPLIRSAVRELAASSDVRRAHRVLAAQFGHQPERRAWHLAEAAIGPDEEVAILLERMARHMLRRGEATRAVAALRLAARLSPRGSDRSLRLAEAACLGAAVTGELPGVPGLLAEARRAAPGPARSLPAAVAEAHLLLNSDGDISTVHQMLADAIRPKSGTTDGGGFALTEALYTWLMVCSSAGRPELWAPLHVAVADLIPGAPADLPLVVSICADPARSASCGLDQLDAGVSELAGEADHGRIVALGAAAACTDRLAGCCEALRRVVRDSREGGAVLPAISALTLLCHDSFMTGAWDEAQRLAGECLQACQAYGYPSRAWMAREHLALIAAARGDDDLVRELTGEMLRWALPRGVTAAQLAARRAGSLAALGRGDFEEAYREAAAISPPGSLAPHALPVMMDLVEAAVRIGRQQEAAAHVAAMRAARIAEISPRLTLLATASAALTVPACEAGRLFEQALALPAIGRWPFELARVHLAYGEHLRRARATSDARTHLATALTTFGALGARPWADRAANELRATRLIVTRTEYHGTAVLTAQEHQIATLAAAGLTNKQIGQRLYLSPRTISAHLYRIFPKLGISTRAALRDALAALPPGDSLPTALAEPLNTLPA
jgi:DNA-binding CsgD family transcriptional regulator